MLTVESGSLGLYLLQQPRLFVTSINIHIEFGVTLKGEQYF